jgi:hypothetical protein
MLLVTTANIVHVVKAMDATIKFNLLDGLSKILVITLPPRHGDNAPCLFFRQYVRTYVLLPSATPVTRSDFE